MNIHDHDEQISSFQHESSKFKCSRHSISQNSIVIIEYINSFFFVFFSFCHLDKIINYFSFFTFFRLLYFVANLFFCKFNFLKFHIMRFFIIDEIDDQIQMNNDFRKIEIIYIQK